MPFLNQSGVVVEFVVVPKLALISSELNGYAKLEPPPDPQAVVETTPDALVERQSPAEARLDTMRFVVLAVPVTVIPVVVAPPFKVVSPVTSKVLLEVTAPVKFPPASGM